MRILPAVDLMEGATVQLVGGDPAARAVHEVDAVAAARRWVAQGAQGLHLVDLDAALDKGDNRELVTRILDAVDVPVQIGGGIRDDESIDCLLTLGAHRLVVGTRAMKDPEWFAAAAHRYPGRLVAALDARDGQVVVDGWRGGTGIDVADAARRLDDLSLAGILCTAVQVEGRMAGVDAETIVRLVQATEHPVIASGGISSADDIRTLRRAGAEACVIGLALYTGRLPLSDALAAAQGDA